MLLLLIWFQNTNFPNYVLINFANGIDLSTQWERKNLNIVAIISYTEIMGSLGISLFQTLQRKNFPHIPFFIVSDFINKNLLNLALQAGITDVFISSVNPIALKVRIPFVIENWKTLNKVTNTRKHKIYKIPFAKKNIRYSLYIISITHFISVIFINNYRT